MHLPPFETLIDAHAYELHRFLVGLVGPTEAEDCLQETYMSALRAYPRLRHGDNLRAWLYTIAHNTVIDHYRTRKPTTALEDVQLSQPDYSEAVESEIDLAVEMKTIKVAMRNLTTDQQQVLTLRFIDGMSNNEIAQHLGKREGAIRALQMRGLQALAKQLAEKMVT